MNSEADYFQRTIAEAPPPPRPSTNLPANMNVTNGYGDVDIPSPPPFAGRDVRYQAVAEAAAGLKTPKKAENNQEKTIFDAEGICLSIFPASSFRSSILFELLLFL